MKRIEAPTLEEAYKQAAKEFNCSITEINYEIVQRPTTGMMGLFKKPAIIVAVKKITTVIKESTPESMTTKEDIAPQEEKRREEPSTERESESDNLNILDKKVTSEDSNIVLDSFFDSQKEGSEAEKSDKAIHLFDDDRDAPENKKCAIEIEEKLKALMQMGCFEIDTVEVDVFNNTAHIFIDGDDAALLIGKEGYRYNALSYMLFNWINARYDLYIKLEIAEFIQAQEEMIENYLKPIIEHINEKGRGKTKVLDGILVQIALEQLRATFPNKYVAIKTAKDGRKFIIVNNFNSKKNG